MNSTAMIQVILPILCRIVTAKRGVLALLWQCYGSKTFHLCAGMDVYYIPSLLGIFVIGDVGCSNNRRRENAQEAVALTTSHYDATWDGSS